MEEIDLTDTYLELELKLKSYLSSYFMNYLSYYIGAKSKINYHMGASIKNKLFIPIYPYEIEESHMTPIDLIKRKIDELQAVLSGIKWKESAKEYYWLISSIIKEGFEFDSSLVCNVVSTSLAIKDEFPVPIPIRLSVPIDDKVRVHRVVSDDKSIITTIVDTHVVDYGLYIDISVPFDEMGIMSNGLHLYEHLCTKAWDGLNEKDMLIMNGSTAAVGTAYIYTVHRTYESFKRYLDATVNFIGKARSKSFWTSDKMKEFIHKEVIRTISETRLERSSSLMARADPHAYEHGYNTDVFHYWSNRPFNILCVVTSPEEEFATRTKLNNISKMYPLIKVARPPNRMYRHAPIEAFITKMVAGYKTIKTSPVDNAKRVLSKRLESNTIYGVDCKIHISAQGAEDGNTCLSALLFYNRYIDENTLERYCNKNIMPYSNLDYIMPMTSAFSSEYYNK